MSKRKQTLEDKIEKVLWDMIAQGGGDASTIKATARKLGGIARRMQKNARAKTLHDNLNCNGAS